MSNKINELLHQLHSGLSVAENKGDILDYLPYLEEIEELIAAAKDDPAQLADFDPDGINNGYRAEGCVWCDCEDAWMLPEDMKCSCIDAVDEDEDEGAPILHSLDPDDLNDSECSASRRGRRILCELWAPEIPTIKLDPRDTRDHTTGAVLFHERREAGQYRAALQLVLHVVAGFAPGAHWTNKNATLAWEAAKLRVRARLDERIRGEA